MKKLILALLFVVSSVVTHAQHVYDIETVSYIVWENKKWIVKESNNPQNMTITTYSDIAIIDDRNKTIYRMDRESETINYPTHKVVQWKAHDNDGKECMFVVKRTYDPESMIILTLYDGTPMYGFEYILKN